MKNLTFGVYLTALAGVGSAAPHFSSSSSGPASAPTGATYASGFDMTKSWANLSPYKNADTFGVPKGMPQGCELSQVHVLHRHAERFPTSNLLDGRGMGDFASKLVNYTKAKPGKMVAKGPLKFLNDWEYVIGENTLMENGAATEDASGADFWIKYGRLLYRPGRDNVAAWNESLNVYPNGTARPKPVFIPRYTKNALSRLASYLPEDFNLTAYDVLAMQNLCVYENTSLGGSFFCSLFTEQEWKDFAYNVDIQYYGNFAFGSPTGRAQGIGYVLELAARLEGKLIHSSDTSINSTYDDNTTQFPLGQPFYMDMSHDDIILSVISALGLEHFKYGPHGLPINIDHAPSNRTFALNDLTPFGARFMSEVWTCPSNVSFDSLDPILYVNPRLESTRTTKRYIRFVLNNAPLPLDGLVGCEDSQNGFCAVDGFLSGVPTLKENAKYQEACFGEYPTGKQVEDGVPYS
ncbi:unnamed protein product [Aspergillus oryzae]|nr:unnamed protein product [Aspergillus oryzae]GMF97379.1 unnamed protein product [Aspergillus oryzae]